jgi:predicted RNase H-like HicB family nuclease
MFRQFTLEYWLDDGWYVGRLKEIPGVFSHGKTLEDLEESIREAYQLMMEPADPLPADDIQTKEIGVEIAAA